MAVAKGNIFVDSTNNRLWHIPDEVSLPAMDYVADPSQRLWCRFTRWAGIKDVSHGLYAEDGAAVSVVARNWLMVAA